MASPANRRRAREAGIDLATVVGSGPGGRILRNDVTAAGAAAAPADHPAETTEIKVIGLRRLIRRAHERGQTQHSALRIRRGSGRDRTRVRCAIT